MEQIPFIHGLLETVTRQLQGIYEAVMGQLQGIYEAVTGQLHRCSTYASLFTGQVKIRWLFNI